jgi:hypothetical protein
MVLLDDFTNLKSEMSFDQQLFCLTIAQIGINIVTTNLNLAHYPKLIGTFSN